jgi:hypothetical protein
MLEISSLSACHKAPYGIAGNLDIVELVVPFLRDSEVVVDRILEQEVVDLTLIWAVLGED